MFETLKEKSGHALPYNRKAQYYRIIDVVSQTIHMHFDTEETTDAFRSRLSSLNGEGEAGYE